MTEKNKLRHTLREHFDNQDYDAVPAEWAKTEKLLQASRNKRRNLLIFFVFTVTFLTGFLLSTLTDTSNSFTTTQSLSATAKKKHPRRFRV